MSALGQKQTYAVQNGMSALPPKATSNATQWNVGFVWRSFNILNYLVTLNQRVQGSSVAAVGSDRRPIGLNDGQYSL